MFSAQRRQPPRQQTGGTISRPAPVGGWNARDALANMPPTDAVSLINWWPTPSLVQVRQGYTNFSTGYVAAVETVAGYQGATPKLFGCSNGNIYDATAGGAIGAAVVSGLANNRWQYLNYTTTGGVRYLLMFNGADKPRYWDGTTWTAVDGVSTPAITGMTTTDIVAATSHKSRLWLVRKNSLELYYLPVGAVGGAVSLYDLRPVFKRGGKIVSIETWSADAGIGLQDHFVIGTDQGEIAIYMGSDPTSISTWALVGVYYLGGSIIGNRPFVKFGGDVLVICQYGLLQLSALLQSMVISTAKTITDKIQNQISVAVTASASAFGWQTLSWQPNNMLILNVPITSTTFEQYVMSTLTGAWARFQNWNAYSWEVFNDGLYFGGSNVIAKAWSGFDDAGANITTDLKTAFDYLGAPGRLKQWLMCRPIISSNGIPGVSYGLNVDFDDSDVTTTPSFAPITGSLWGSALWGTAIWGGGAALTLQKAWQYISGLGYAGSLRMKTTSRGITVQLSAIDYLYEEGGVL